MQEARFYEKRKDMSVSCRLCSHHCTIAAGKRGICGVRENQAGTLMSLVYGKLVSENLDPIEKKPLFNFLPGSTSYSIATVGCNFQCAHCQNWEISQYPRLHHDEIIGMGRSPNAVVDEAVLSGARSISYTYVEPTIFYEFAYDCSALARKKMLKNVFVSNGYMTPEVTRELATVIDAINIDIKAFTEKFYHKFCKARLAPVLDTVKLMHELGVWVEVTTLIIPGHNDSPEELREIAQFIHSVDPSIPWHVTAFYPHYQMLDVPPTPASTLRMARDIGLAQGLRFVYEGNIPGEGGENTFCPSCGTMVISRHGFRILKNNLKDGHCPSCGAGVPGIWS
ncbi:MAG: AmmeMemoRadiSam system radical SAM enzyme [Deltaproteobacteria bacterium]